MNRKRSARFRGRHFEDVVILLCVRWYLRYSLSYRDLEEIVEERGLSVSAALRAHFESANAAQSAPPQSLVAGG